MRSLKNLVNAETVRSGEAWIDRIGFVATVAAVVAFRRWLSSEFMLLRTTGIIHFGHNATPNSAMDMSESLARLRDCRS